MSEPRRPPGMRRSPEAKRADLERTRLLSAIGELCEAADLTDVEVLQVLNTYQASVLKFMLRAERHPDDPDRPADAH